MTKTITARLPDDYIKNLDEVAKKEQVDISTALRKLLAEAFVRWKIANALEELRKGEISIGKASEKANVSIWDMIVLAKENKIDWMEYTEEDLQRDIKIIKKLESK